MKYNYQPLQRNMWTSNKEQSMQRLFQAGIGTDLNGQDKCELVYDPREQIRQNLGIQEKIDI